MIRALVLLLALANALLLAANLGWLDPLFSDQHQREPERLARQVNAEQLGLAPAAAASDAALPDAADVPAASAPFAPGAAAASGASVASTASGAAQPGGLDPAATAPGSAASASAADPASAAASAALNPAPAAPAPASAALAAAVSASRSGTLCVQASPVNPDQLDKALAALRGAGLPDGSWRTERLAPIPRYLILMGRYDSRDTVQRKEGELRRRDVDWVSLQAAPDMPSGYVPGLGLGRYDDEASAKTALARLEARRVNTARIVELPPAPGQVLLRVPGLTAAQQARVSKLEAPANTRWLPCPAAGNGQNGAGATPGNRR